MKKLILSIALAIATHSVFANTCNIVVPIKPGGATDIVARIMQKYNPNITIDYRPGVYVSAAISYAENNPSAGIITLPTMYSSQNPNKNPNVTAIKVFGSYDHGIITNKDITISDILTKKMNVGISFFGSPAHVIGEQLKEKNPNINLVSFGGDTNALASVKNGDVDVYITAWPSIESWTNDFKFKTLLKITAGAGVMIEDIKLTNISLFAIFMSNNSTREQRSHMLNCVNTALNNEGLKNDFKKIYMNILNEDEEKATKSIQNYINTLIRYGI